MVACVSLKENYVSLVNNDTLCNIMFYVVGRVAHWHVKCRASFNSPSTPLWIFLSPDFTISSMFPSWFIMVYSLPWVGILSASSSFTVTGSIYVENQTTTAYAYPRQGLVITIQVDHFWLWYVWLGWFLDYFLIIETNFYIYQII